MSPTQRGSLAGSTGRLCRDDRSNGGLREHARRSGTVASQGGRLARPLSEAAQILLPAWRLQQGAGSGSGRTHWRTWSQRSWRRGRRRTDCSGTVIFARLFRVTGAHCTLEYVGIRRDVLNTGNTPHSKY